MASFGHLGRALAPLSLPQKPKIMVFTTIRVFNVLPGDPWLWLYFHKLLCSCVHSQWQGWYSRDVYSASSWWTQMLTKVFPPSHLNKFFAGSQKKSKKGSAGEFRGKWCSVAICSRATNIGPPLSLLDPTSSLPAPYMSHQNHFETFMLFSSSILPFFVPDVLCSNYKLRLRLSSQYDLLGTNAKGAEYCTVKGLSAFQYQKRPWRPLWRH